MSIGDLYGSAAMKLVETRLDESMQEHGVAPETREHVPVCVSMMYEYIPYALAQKQNPTDSRVLRKFLLAKGINTVKLFGHDGLGCGLSMVEFVLSVNRSVPLSGIPVAGTLSWGLAMIDLIDVGNSCEFAQQAYHEAFLSESSVPLGRGRQRYRKHVHHEQTKLRPWDWWSALYPRNARL